MQEKVKFLCIHAYEFLTLESTLKYSKAGLSSKYVISHPRDEDNKTDNKLCT